MSSQMFQYDNPFFQLMGKLWDLMILNLLALLLCVPVVTAGASLTALYYVTLKMAEERDSHIYQSFFKAFRDNFLQSVWITLILGAAGLIFSADAWFLFFWNGAGGAVFWSGGVLKFLLLPLVGVLFVLLVLLALYVFAVQARFENPVRRTLFNALLMGVRHLPMTVMMLAADLCFFYLMLQHVSWLGLWLLSGPVYMNSFFLSKIFQKYM